VFLRFVCCSGKRSSHVTCFYVLPATLHRPTPPQQSFRPGSNTNRTGAAGPFRTAAAADGGVGVACGGRGAGGGGGGVGVNQARAPRPCCRGCSFLFRTFRFKAKLNGVSKQTCSTTANLLPSRYSRDIRECIAHGTTKTSLTTGRSPSP